MSSSNSRGLLKRINEFNNGTPNDNKTITKTSPSIPKIYYKLNEESKKTQKYRKKHKFSKINKSIPYFKPSCTKICDSRKTFVTDYDF